MARKQKHPEHINHERWLVSYADFVTLLFAFFTALYAMSTVDAKKAGKMLNSTREAFNMDLFPSDRPVLGMSQPVETLEFAHLRRPKEPAKPESPQKKPPDYAPDGAMNLKQFRALIKDLNKTISGKNLKGIKVSNNKYGVVISLHDAIYFDEGRADLKRSALPALDALAERIVDSHLDMRVEGHTDGSPSHGGRYRSNWELSTARASSVVTYFIEQFAYPPEQLSVAGYASTKPLTTATTPAARARNRRVDLVLLMPKHDWLPSPSDISTLQEDPQPSPSDGATAPSPSSAAEPASPAPPSAPTSQP